MEINEPLLYRTVGERLKQHRRSCGLTQSQLAAATGMQRTTIANIESGRQKASLSVLYQLCAVLKIEVSRLLPTVVDVTQGKVVELDIDGRQARAWPRTAEFLQQLIDE